MTPISPISKKLLYGTGGVAISGLGLARYFNWWPFNLQLGPLLTPPNDTKQGNRIFLPIRYADELYPILMQKPPLLLNFTYRRNPECDKLTGALQRIVALETDKKINLVDIEASEPGTRELMLEYRVDHVPMVVALRKQLIVDSYIDKNLTQDPNKEVDWINLKNWIENIAQD
ncbi:hypothetical protein PACTADRAFT_32521 [Pachysolen tannophilus NRRL Y-2460]|uniref:Thioredoxin domain-containing protein n=1 Tax=Pachysolen tannophilus NRRL Y-2460 TaxID=669874 RepID=A0A1E4TZ61_PACTA|nr:hypothetical protein PACTADRAFT_32521 [Pachysolen tannophilus NRRL Y-2460]